MITMLLFGIAFAGFGGFGRWFAKDIDRAIQVVGAMLWGMVGIAIGAGVAAGIGVAMIEKSESVELVAFADSTRTEGSFFLGSGNVGEKSVYVYYYRLPNGDIAQGRQSATAGDGSCGRCSPSVTIREEAGECKPRLEATWREPAPEGSLWGIGTSSRTRYRFIVPRGTVVRNFSADLR